MPKIIDDEPESTFKLSRTKTSSKLKNAVLKQPRASDVPSLVGDILSWLQSVPLDWIADVPVGDHQIQEITSKPCSSYKTLVLAWRKAMRWRQDMDDVLSIMLAVVASTVQQGDQLFLMVIGSASGGKTRFCEGLLVSKHCHALEYLTGFFSGITDSSGKDYSLINRVNRKCMITPEGDVMLKNPNSLQIFAESRRIFDGTISASFKTKMEDKKYSGLRTPWIMAGTPAMLENDQASLGDRFLKIYLDSPSNSERREILQRISRSAMESVQIEAEGDELVGEKLLEAYRLTGGYVDWLRDNTDLLKHISVEEQYLERCECLSELTAFLRARPSTVEGGVEGKEEPNRINAQLVRAMCTLTLTLNKTSVDEEIMRRIKKLALDTGKGIVLDIIECINRSQNQHVSLKSAAIQLDIEEIKLMKVFKFMKNIGAIKLSAEEGVRRGTKPLWGFTSVMKELVNAVLNEE